MRADQLLVERGMAPTRSAAQRLIATGAVRWRAPAGWRVPSKAGEDLPTGADVEITDDAELRFVSRGGLKLDGALARLELDVAGMTCLDLGQSTGGFTDVLLQRGVKHVVGVDVGHGQPRVRQRAVELQAATRGIAHLGVVGDAQPGARVELQAGLAHRGPAARRQPLDRAAGEQALRGRARRRQAAGEQQLVGAHGGRTAAAQPPAAVSAQ